MNNFEKSYRLMMATLRSIAKKEIWHIMRDPSVFILAFIFPLLEFALLGYVLDINIKRIDTVVYDLANTQDSKRLVQKFINTDVFNVVQWANSEKELQQAIVSGNARVGIKIPVDYSDRLMSGDTASVLVLVDGSNANLTNTVVNVSNSVTLQESVKLLLSNDADNSGVPVEMRPSVLFNPDTSSANFFLPGLIVYEMPSITIILLAFAVAGERERGTMDQLNVMPCSTTGLILGKMIPYGLLALVQLVELVLVTRYVFHVPMNGNPLYLVLFCLPFLLCDLSFGTIVAAKAQSVGEAGHLGTLFRILPFYFSGYIFPLESAHPWLQFISNFIPHRYFLEIMRGVFLRGAGFSELWPQGLTLLVIGTVLFCFAIRRYQKSA